MKSFSFAVSSVWGFWKFSKSSGSWKKFEVSENCLDFTDFVSKDNQLSWMRSGDQLCSPGVFCLLIYRIFVLFRDKLVQLLPIYAKSRGRKKIVYLTLSYNGGWRFLFFASKTKVRLTVSFAVVLNIDILLKQINFTKFQLFPQLGLIYYSSS